MKDVYKLRKKVEEKSREAELFKRKYLGVLLEWDHIKDEVPRLKDLLRSRDGKIAALEAQIILLKTELKVTNERKSFKIPFVKETEHALFCVEHEVVDAPTNFSEVIFSDEQIAQDPEAFESYISKASSRIKNIKATGTEYLPDDVSICCSLSLCESCSALNECAFYLTNIIVASCEGYVKKS